MCGAVCCCSVGVAAAVVVMLAFLIHSLVVFFLRVVLFCFCFADAGVFDALELARRRKILSHEVSFGISESCLGIVPIGVGSFTWYLYNKLDNVIQFLFEFLPFCLLLLFYCTIPTNKLSIISQ